MMILVLNLTKRFTVTQGNHDLSAASARLIGRPQHEPRHERRPEDHGHHHDGPLQHGLPAAEISMCPCGSSSLCYLIDRPGDHGRRLADRQDHGNEDHEAARPWGASAPRRRRPVSIIGATLFGHPREHDPHHHGRHRGGGCNPRVTAVRWGIAGNIIWAWILTIPMSALIAAFLLSLPVLHVMPQESATHRAASTGMNRKTP